MTYKEAADILRNAAWFGSYEDREKAVEVIEKAVEVIEMAVEALEYMEKMEDDGR